MWGEPDAVRVKVPAGRWTALVWSIVVALLACAGRPTLVHAQSPGTSDLNRLFDRAAMAEYYATLDADARVRAVRLKSRVLVPGRDDSVLGSSVSGHVYVQFTDVLSPENRAHFAELGAQVRDYVTNRTYVVYCAAGSVADVLDDALVEGVAAIHPADKLSGALWGQIHTGDPGPGPARYRIRVYEGEPAADVRAALDRQGIDSVLVEQGDSFVVEATLTLAQITEVAALDGVLAVDGAEATVAPHGPAEPGPTSAPGRGTPHTRARVESPRQLATLTPGEGDSPALPRMRSTSSPKATVESKAGRWEHFFRMVRDPATDSIPEGIRRRELAYARGLPRYGADRSVRRPDGTVLREAAEAISPPLGWTELGPTNVGGRTRALGIDVTNPDVIIAGAASGGIWKSADGGATWAFKTGPTQHLGIVSLAQDVRPGQTHVWYASTGESRGTSATDLGGRARYRGAGVFKSVDSGETWVQLPTMTGGYLAPLDDPGDYVPRVTVSPTTGTVLFASNYFGIYRSTDGGTSFTRVLGVDLGSPWCDVAIATDGTAVATLSGPAGGGVVAGIFRSLDDGVTWTNITPATFPTSTSVRTVLGFAPSNPDAVYALTDSPGGQLWKITVSTGVASERSTFLPAFGGLTGTFDTQASYDMLVAVKPDDENFVIVGGRNLWRSTDGFQSPLVRTSAWIGGYTSANTSYALYPNHHPDQHIVVFDPTDPTRMWNGNDGGVYVTNVTTPSVVWTDMNHGYNVTQFYTTAIRDAPGSTLVVGGTQDNGSPAMRWDAADPGASTLVFGADGATAHLGATYSYVSAQFGMIVRNPYGGDGFPTVTPWSVVDPAAATYRLFIHPYAVDPVSDNIMYFPSWNHVWRHTNLAGIPNFTQNAPGWQELTHVTSPVDTDISAIAVSTTPAHVLYYGASSWTSPPRIYRLAGANSAMDGEVDISVPGMPSGTYVHAIAVNPQDADEILVVFSSYNIVGLYHSTNGGLTYTAVEGNLEGDIDNPGPSLRCASILPAAGGTQYFVGTSTGLYSTGTLNGGSTVWVQEGPLTIGNAVTAAVATRPGDDIVAVGTHGRGIFLGEPLDAPIVSWVTPPPAEATSGTPVFVEWSLAGFLGPITENQAHVDRGGALADSSPVQAAANGIYAHTFTAPTVTTPTPVPVVARALDNGVEFLSPVHTLTINPLIPVGGVTLTAAPAGSQAETLPVTATASATGGTGSYEYRFSLNGPGTGGGWSVERDWAASATWVWDTTGHLGDNTLRVEARNAGVGGPADVSDSIAYTVTDPAPTSVTVAADPPSPQLAGTVVTLTGTAGGGAGAYEYQFWRRGPDTSGTWVVEQAYGGGPSWVWDTTGAAGPNTVAVTARTAGTTVDWNTYVLVSYAVAPPPATGITLAADPASPQPGGTLVTLTAAGVGGTGAYEFQFWRSGPDTGGGWVREQAYGAGDTFVWDTTGAVGSNLVAATVRTAGTTVPWDTHAIMSYVVVEPPPSTGVVLVSDLASPQPAGALVTFTATGQGGTGAYEFQFWRNGPDTAGGWVVEQPYGGGPSWTWDTTAAAGAHSVVVTVRTFGSTRSWDVFDRHAYTVTTSP